MGAAQPLGVNKGINRDDPQVSQIPGGPVAIGIPSGRGFGSTPRQRVSSGTKEVAIADQGKITVSPEGLVQVQLWRRRLPRVGGTAAWGLTCKGNPEINPQVNCGCTASKLEACQLHQSLRSHYSGNQKNAVATG